MDFTTMSNHCVRLYVTGNLNQHIQIQINLFSDSEETGVPRIFIHLSSAIFGLLTLNYFFGATVVYLLICCFSVYFILVITSRTCQKLSGVSVAVFVVIYIIVW